MTDVRVFFIGGLTSFRALFNWLSPWIYIPSLLVAPVFQILLFAYIGRSAHVQSDEFYVIGNALQYTAIPCVFAMCNTIAGERYQQTLGYILVTPARRIPLFVGRSLPVIVNGALRLGVRVRGRRRDSPHPRAGARDRADRARRPGRSRIVHRPRAPGRGARLRRARDSDPEQHPVRDPPRLHRRERSPLRPAGLDVDPRAGAATHARDRSRPEARRRGVVRRTSAGWSPPRC